VLSFEKKIKICFSYSLTIFPELTSYLTYFVTSGAERMKVLKLAFEYLNIYSSKVAIFAGKRLAKLHH